MLVERLVLIMDQMDLILYLEILLLLVAEGVQLTILMQAAADPVAVLVEHRD